MNNQIMQKNPFYDPEQNKPCECPYPKDVIIPTNTSEPIRCKKCGGLIVIPHAKPPMYVERCRHLDTCDNGKLRDCVGCNVWNYLYDIRALQKWCEQQGEDFMLFTMRMQKELMEKRS